MSFTPPTQGIINSIWYFVVKEIHRIEGAVPSLDHDMMLYYANNGELLTLVDCDWRTGAVTAVSSIALRNDDANTYGFVGLGNTAR